jgi:serine/threonine protein phosphatase PrpC
MSLQLEIGQFSHPGRQRPKNEDWLGAFQPDDAERLARKGQLFLVADGMGGHQSGEMASRYAVDAVIRAYVDHPAPDVETSLRQAIESASSSLYQRAPGGPGDSRWGTTLVAAVVRGAELWIANVGDSRAYLLRGGKLQQLSRDHSMMGQHLITRALGTKPQVEVDLFPPLPLRAGDRVLLCTDGLTRPLPDAEIRAIAGRGTAQGAAEALVRAANEHGGPDNVSVIVIHVTGGPAAEWHTPGELLAALAWPETWRQMVELLPRLLIGDRAAWQSPIAFVVLALAILALLGFGFLLGLLLF